jgi:hypothetical protein
MNFLSDMLSYIMMNTKSKTDESSLRDKNSHEFRDNKDNLSLLEDNEFIEENDCSVLSDFVSALSVDLLQETYNTAKFDSQDSSSPSPDNLEYEQTDPFLGQLEIVDSNEKNFRVEKTIVRMHHSMTKYKRDYNGFGGMSPSMVQYMMMFLVMLTILSITLVIVCSQVTLPGSSRIAMPRPVMISKDQLAILPNGNMVRMVGAKFRAPATDLRIVKYQQSQHGTGV